MIPMEFSFDVSICMFPGHQVHIYIYMYKYVYMHIYMYMIAAVKKK